MVECQIVVIGPLQKRRSELRDAKPSRAARHDCSLSPLSASMTSRGHATDGMAPPRYQRWSWSRSLVRGNVARRQGNCLVDTRFIQNEEERRSVNGGERRKDEERRRREAQQGKEQGQHRPKGDGVYEGTRLGVGAPKSCGRDLRMREGRLWWSIGRRAPQQRRVTAPLFWESGTCFFPLHRRRAFNCTPARSITSAASQAR